MFFPSLKLMYLEKIEKTWLLLYWVLIMKMCQNTFEEKTLFFSCCIVSIVISSWNWNAEKSS